MSREVKKEEDSSATPQVADSELERAIAATMNKLEKSETTSPIKSSAPKDSPSSKGGTRSEAETAALDQEYDIRRRQVDKYRELIMDKYRDGRVNTNMSWEQALKHLQHDPRFKILQKMSEKKQVFNSWKTQRAKEERDEKRLAIKKAKEDLEKWLLENPRMKSTLRYHKAEKLFSSEEHWKAVCETERREIFRDLLVIVEQREIKQKKELKERNIKVLAEILDNIEDISHTTTWAQAQRILIENHDFANDSILQGMDKEDALVVFQGYIENAEKLYEKEKQLELKRHKRIERKVRENFVQFLQELNSKGILVSVSTWSALYPTISADPRFENMLTQTGSTALDLFKFYVEDLKNRYYEDRHIIREVLKDLNAVVTINTSFDQLQQWIRSDDRGKTVDTGNMKLCYNSLFDKAQAKEKENEREILRKRKRQETAFRDILKLAVPAVEPTSEWKDVRERIKEEAFKLVETEETRQQFFDNYIKSISEACGHHHGSSNLKKKKKDKKRGRSKMTLTAMLRSKRRTPSPSSDEGEILEGKVKAAKIKKEEKAEESDA
uniref:FF domain-containing protein n=1 Tax=Ditylenchus dipsaci TaxID=166011 RepID=A0A915D1L9_9BILA